MMSSSEFSRSVKKDVYQIVKGPCEDDNQYYLLGKQKIINFTGPKFYILITSGVGV